MFEITPDTFLDDCSRSSQAAYDKFKFFADAADSHENKKSLRRFLSSLIRHIEGLNIDTDMLLEKYHFSFNLLTLDGDNLQQNRLTLLQLPSTFTPEEWSFTFYEGLSRYPASEFQGRRIAELGCGNGWITIALAKRSLPAQIIGLDINPRAITCARINLILNGLDEAGEFVFDHDGKTLFDRVDFQTSDLLAHVINEGIQLDRVVGCIPQVLRPEPALANEFIREESEDQFLFSLSNYCDKQGYIEDQFGLGLIARAIEESISVCRPSAKVILNMGGRPGAAVLERLFTRRGFSTRQIWTTKVWQAEDTDIQPLVDIETCTPHRFEFYTSLNSDEPICARTAKAFADNGGRIAHSLCVYEAQLKQTAPIKSLFRLLTQQGFEDSRNSIDLSFANEEIADEKINFAGSLADWLKEKPNLPYADTEGESQLRRQIAQYLRSYYRIPTTAKSIFVCPDRKTAIKNILHLFRPSLSLIDKNLIQSLSTTTLSSELSDSILESPSRVDEVCKLIANLKPQIVITTLQDFEIKTSDAFIRLSDVCFKNSARLIIDLSRQFELSSQPEHHGVLSYIADHPLPEHVCLLIGLINNKVYRDLEICFFVTENSQLLNQLSGAAELSYSRPPLLTQKYYSRIFSDLLNFQLNEVRYGRAEELRLPKSDHLSDNSLLPSFVQSAFSHPSICKNEITIDRYVTRLDYGENNLKSPSHVHAAIMESFLRQNFTTSELNVESSISNFAAQRFGFTPNSQQILIANGIAPLFAAFLESLSKSDGTIAIPTGAYGYFAAACDFYNVKMSRFSTERKNNFKVSASQLEEFLTANKCGWIYLNAPTVNPTGAVFTNEELVDICDVLKRHECGLIIDTIFSGLEYNKGRSNFCFDEMMMQMTNNQKAELPIIIMGGLSKEMAAGGLRFGWAFFNQPELMNSVRNFLPAQPHTTVRFAARRIYQYLADPDHPIHVSLDEQRAILSERSFRLSQLLNKLGWDVIGSEGGLFLSASPDKYIRQILEETGVSPTLNKQELADSVAQMLLKQTGLLLNNATWTGLPSHLRFVISVSDPDFECALEKLRQFDTMWK